MTIQWSLVIFTSLVGTACWLFAPMGLSLAKGDAVSRKAKTGVSVTALVLLVVGAIASITHLSHPERVMAALGHPTMGIFAEALLVGVTAILLIVFLLMVRRNAGEGAIKGMGVVTAVVAVVFSFLLGYSYVMGARDAWNTVLLPLGYLGTAAAAGTGLYLMLVAKEGQGTVRFAAAMLVAGGACAAVTALLYGFASGTAMGGQALLFWVAVVICGGIAPIACGVLARRTGQAAAYGLAGLVLGLVGCVGFRCLMWLAGSGINFFSPIG